MAPRLTIFLDFFKNFINFEPNFFFWEPLKRTIFIAFKKMKNCESFFKGFSRLSSNTQRRF